MNLLVAGGCDEGRLAELEPFFIAGSSNRQIIQNISYNIILATYIDLESQLRKLDLAAQNFENTPGTGNLQTTRLAWLQARISMKEAEMYFYGPNANLFVDANLDCWVRGTSRCNTTGDCGTSVDGIIASSDGISVTAVGLRGAGVRGFSAVEYLLYDDGSGNSDLSNVNAALTGRRLHYLIAATGDMLQTGIRLRQGWDPSGLNHAGELATAGAGSRTYAKLLDGLSQIISGMLTQLQSIRDKKIGYAAGFTLKSGGSLHLSDVESPYSGNSLVEIKTTLSSVSNIYEGRFGNHQGPGLSDSVQRLNPELDQYIKSQFSGLQIRLSQLQTNHGNLETAIQSDLTGVRRVYDDLQILRITLATDLVSVSGTNPGISPNDGD